MPGGEKSKGGPRGAAQQDPGTLRDSVPSKETLAPQSRRGEGGRGPGSPAPHGRRWGSGFRSPLPGFYAERGAANLERASDPIGAPAIVDGAKASAEEMMTRVAKAATAEERAHPWIMAGSQYRGSVFNGVQKP